MCLLTETRALSAQGEKRALVGNLTMPLEGHLELLRCHYNFVRPHRALKFGRDVRTPAMQAGLATRRLTFREVFVCQPLSLSVRIDAIAWVVPSRAPSAPGRKELLAA